MIEKALQYITGVKSGDIIAPKWIRLAIDRHHADLERTDWNFYFDDDEAERILNLFPLFRYSKGDKSGQPFEIMPWFSALVYMAYGWRRNSGGRRFRKVYCKVPRGNAKTANLVNIATIEFLFAGQGDAEVYWLAMNQDQAKIGWDRQREMLKLLVSDHVELKDLVYIPEGRTSKRITLNHGLSLVEYIGQDSDGRDGRSPSCIIADETHEWKNFDLLNKFESGMVKVQNPVTWMITTAGYLPQGPNSDFIRACKNVLQGITDDPELLCFIYEMDEGDEWKDPAVWAKVNPGIGYCLSIDNLQTEFNKITSGGMPKEIDFRVKNLNEEYASQDGWITDEQWMECAGELDWNELRERECWAGLDLANTNDFNAFVLFFPPTYPGQRPVTVPYFWVTEDAIRKSAKQRPFLSQWVRDGFVRETPGTVADYDRIRDDILEIVAPLRLQAVAFDRALSAYLVPKLLEDGLRMEPYQQSWMHLSPPAQYFERTVLGSEMLHDGNPVARWMMQNIAMQYDRNRNYLPSKGASADKIDFIAAELNAIGQWLTDRGESKFTSYLFDETTTLLTI